MALWLWQWLRTAGDNFGVVDEGKVYRSAALSEAGLRRAVERHGLRTVLDLRLDPGGVPPQIPGVTHRNAPLDDHGAVDVALVESCADLLADPAAQPVLVHCQGGRHRTGAVVAAYRVRHCGWTPQRAREEADAFGFYGWQHGAWEEYLRNL